MNPPARSLHVTENPRIEKSTTTKSYKQALCLEITLQETHLIKENHLIQCQPGRPDWQFEIQNYKAGAKWPSIVFPKKVSKTLSLKWEHILIIRILEPARETVIIERQLANLWKIRGGMDRKELGFGFDCVHDLNEDDRTRITAARPWRLGSKPILIRTWTPNFSVEKESTKMVTSIWFTIRLLPLEYHT